MTKTWRPLFSGQDSLPTLLVSTAFTPDSYTVYLTDLTYIWGEALSRAEIVTRSQDEATIIELADEGDEENLQVFLQKIRGALDGQHGTTVDLKVSADGQRRRAVASLTLAVTSEVKALGILNWTFKMEPVPQHTLTDGLILPLIRAQRARTTEQSNLLEVLKEKDHVIQKLVDKLESQGTDLGQVFPGAAGKGGRKVTKAWAEERIKGLGTFDEEVWKRGNAVDDIEANKLLSDVFGSDSTLNLTAGEKYVTEKSKSWWEGQEKAIRLSTKEESASGSNDAKKLKLSREESTDDFQVQETPPGKTSSRAVKDISVESTDDDDDDLDAPSQVIPDSFPTAPPKVTKLSIGGLRGSRPAPRITAAQDEATETEGEPTGTPPKKAPLRKLPSKRRAQRKGPFLGDDSTESEGEVLPMRRKANPKIDSPSRDTDTESRGGSSPARKVAAPVEHVTESEHAISPPRVKISTSKNAPQETLLADDEETESDSETSAPKNTAANKSPLPKPSAKPRQEESETEDEHSPPPKKNSRIPELKDKSKSTAPKLGGLKKKIAPPSDDDSVSEDSTQQPAKKKLGGLQQKGLTKEAQKPKARLGGLRRKPVISMSDDDSGGDDNDDDDDEGEAETDVPKKPGGFRKRTPVQDEHGLVRGRTEKKIETPPPRETSEERANKKREELKRDLEEKAAKGPVKKKRKF